MLKHLLELRNVFPEDSIYVWRTTSSDFVLKILQSPVPNKQLTLTNYQRPQSGSELRSSSPSYVNFVKSYQGSGSDVNGSATVRDPHQAWGGETSIIYSMLF